MRNTVSALEPLLQPQERLDRLIASAFRRFGPRLVDLSYANPHGGPSADVCRVLERVTAECTGSSLQYTPYGGRTATRRAVADAVSREYGLPFEYRDVIMTSGAMSALNVVFRALFEPADEVIVLTPAWHDYPLYLRNQNMAVRFVPLRPDKQLDVPAIAAAIGPRTRGVLFSQPCCPTGSGVLAKTEIVRAIRGADGGRSAIRYRSFTRSATKCIVISRGAPTRSQPADRLSEKPDDLFVRQSAVAAGAADRATSRCRLACRETNESGRDRAMRAAHGIR